jgi:hypothetical protein
VSPKLEVHGLGTRNTGNEQTMPYSIAYNKDICNLFGSEHNNSGSAGVQAFIALTTEVVADVLVELLAQQLVLSLQPGVIRLQRDDTCT